MKRIFWGFVVFDQSNCWLQRNPDGQTMLASTITPIPQSIAQGNDWLLEDGSRLSFGRLALCILLRFVLGCGDLVALSDTLVM